MSPIIITVLELPSSGFQNPPTCSRNYLAEMAAII